MAAEFTTLHLIRDGTGPYHVNRFRIYFTPLKSTTLAELANDFMANFVVLFNGGRAAPPAPGTLPAPVTPPAPSPGRFPALPPVVADETRVVHPVYLPIDWLTLNAAQVSSHRIAGETMLRFTGDMRIWWGDINAPDIHDDWVSESWHSDGVGMAMQTQRFVRPPLEVSDVYLLSLPPPLGPILRENKRSFQAFNDDHFLAGRRSWVLGEERALHPRPTGQTSAKAVTAATGATHRYSAEMPIYWYLETAALERYSSSFYRLVEATAPASGVVFPDLKESIKKVWVTLLYNFSKWYHLETAVLGPGPAIWPSPTEVRRNIRFAMQSYKELDECLAQPWVKQMLGTHPSLSDQINEMPKVVVTAKKRSTAAPEAGGGAGGGGGGGW